MVGGWIIENKIVTILDDNGKAHTYRRLWCIDRHDDECAVLTDTKTAQMLQVGEQIWWRAEKIYAGPNDSLYFRKIGNSFDPRKVDHA